jgi:transposase
VPELQALPSNPAQGKAELDRWVFAPRGGTHPLRHLAIIYWLFPSWADFIATYAEAHTTAQAAVHMPPSVVLADARRTAFVADLTAGHSVTAASKRIGITAGTGLAWAAQHGFKTSRRPKTVTELLQRSIADDLARGDDKADIAHRHRVSVQAVTRVLRSEVGLADRRRRAQRDRSLHMSRQAWTAARDAWPGATVAHLREHAGAAYAWLRRHDKDWLDSHLPERLQRLPATPRVDWDRRDIELAEAVRRVASGLATGSADQRLRPWQIYQALPELKAKQGALARLPLTSRALAEVTRRVRETKGQSVL